MSAPMIIAISWQWINYMTITANATLHSHQSGAYWCYEIGKQNCPAERELAIKRRGTSSRSGENPQIERKQDAGCID